MNPVEEYRAVMRIAFKAADLIDGVCRGDDGNEGDAALRDAEYQGQVGADLGRKNRKDINAFLAGASGDVVPSPDDFEFACWGSSVADAMVPFGYMHKQAVGFQRGARDDVGYELTLNQVDRLRAVAFRYDDSGEYGVVNAALDLLEHACDKKPAIFQARTPHRSGVSEVMMYLSRMNPDKALSPSHPECTCECVCRKWISLTGKEETRFSREMKVGLVPASKEDGDE